VSTGAAGTSCEKAGAGAGVVAARAEVAGASRTRMAASAAARDQGIGAPLSRGVHRGRGGVHGALPPPAHAGAAHAAAQPTPRREALAGVAVLPGRQGREDLLGAA